MSVVKITNKKALEQLQAKLTMRIGQKLTQQETLDYCVLLADQNFDKLVEIIMKMPTLTPEKVNRFLRERDELSDVPYSDLEKFENPDDNDIYK